MTNATRLQEVCRKIREVTDFEDKKYWADQFDKLNKTAPKGLIPFYNWLRKNVDTD